MKPQITPMAKRATPSYLNHLKSPTVRSPGSTGGQALCGEAGNENDNGKGKQPYNYRYPSVANCSCVSGNFKPKEGGYGSWPQKTGTKYGCERTEA